jgi:hypothetical protein
MTVSNRSLHRADAVADAVGDLIGNADEAPEQFDRALAVLSGQPGHDGLPEVIEFVQQRLPLLPGDEGTRPTDHPDPLVDLGGECVRPLGSGEQHAELLPQDRIGAGVRNQHLGQYISTDGSKGFPGEGLSAGHETFCSVRKTVATLVRWDLAGKSAHQAGR